MSSLAFLKGLLCRKSFVRLEEDPPQMWGTKVRVYCIRDSGRTAVKTPSEGVDQHIATGLNETSNQ